MHGACIYHDNGASAWTDHENVCDGSFDHYFALNGASPGRYGKFGVCESCPDQSGAQANCSIEFTRNYLRTNGTVHWKHPAWRRQQQHALQAKRTRPHCDRA
jgi:hypothetical protein